MGTEQAFSVLLHEELSSLLCADYSFSTREEQQVLESIAQKGRSEDCFFGGGGLKSLLGRPCSFEGDVKLMTEWQSGSHFLLSGPLKFFLGHVITNLVRIQRKYIHSGFLFT